MRNRCERASEIQPIRVGKKSQQVYHSKQNDPTYPPRIGSFVKDAIRHSSICENTPPQPKPPPLTSHPSKIPLTKPNLHPLRPHSLQPPHSRTFPHRPLRLQFHLAPSHSHLLKELQQFDPRILYHIIRPSSGRRGLESLEPSRKGYRHDLTIGVVVKVFGDSRDEGFPSARMRVHDVVVFGPDSRWLFGFFDIGEEKIDDDFGRGVDWDPGYCVLAGNACWDFAQVFGAGYKLKVRTC